MAQVLFDPHVDIGQVDHSSSCFLLDLSRTRVHATRLKKLQTLIVDGSMGTFSLAHISGKLISAW